MLPMNLGRIKCFFQAKGYGFIEDNDGREIYFHYTSIEKSHPSAVVNGATVYFEAISTSMGLEANRVQLSRPLTA